MVRTDIAVAGRGQSRSTPSEEHATEVDGTHAVAHLLEADGIVFERVAQEQQPLLEPECSGRRDLADDEMTGVFDRRIAPAAAGALYWARPQVNAGR